MTYTYFLKGTRLRSTGQALERILAEWEHYKNDNVMHKAKSTPIWHLKEF